MARVRRTKEQIAADKEATYLANKSNEVNKFKHLKYTIEVPHGFKEIAQKYCKQHLGHPYFIYDPWSGKDSVNSKGVWVYHSVNKVGTMYFKNEEHVKLVGQAITLTLLKK
jgi:hypothetical protein